MLAEYREVETVKYESKPVTEVHFNSDYDTKEICTRFGNWSRLGLYLRQNTPSYYDSQPKKYKEICSDEDAKLINEAFLDLLNTNTKNAKDIYDILMLHYFGDKKVIEDFIATDGSVLEEVKRIKSGDHYVPNFKKMNKSIRFEELYIVTPMTIKDIANKIGISWDKAKELKQSGEDFLQGYFSAMSKAGKKLDLMYNIKYLK